jgi:hypothetical protein
MRNNHILTARQLLWIAAVSCMTVVGVRSQPSGGVPTDLTQRAEIIAVGKIASLEPQWSEDGGSIVTRVTLKVGEYLKGTGGQALVLVTPGGEVGGVGEYYSHAARFSRDEEVVVFAERNMQGGYRVTGGHRGKLTITSDAGTGVRRVASQQLLDDLKSAVAASVQKDVDH